MYNIAYGTFALSIYLRLLSQPLDILSINFADKKDINWPCHKCAGFIDIKSYVSELQSRAMREFR